jgi:lactate permease
VPFWLIWAFAGRKAMWDIWPAILVTGLNLRHHAVPGLQLPSAPAGGHHRRHRVDGLAGRCPAVWKPKKVWTSTTKGHENDTSEVIDVSEKPHGHEADAGAAIFAKPHRRAVVRPGRPGPS